jgi:nucleotide-binding universal stress UspA family protein
VFTSILCPVDFSENSECALRYAQRLAALTGARLHVMTAIDPLLEAASQAAGHHALVEQTRTDLRALLNRLGISEQASDQSPTLTVVTGQPARAILDQIPACGADLVVMGTQGAGAVERLVFGSTTNRVLRESRVPVLAVPLPGSRHESEHTGATGGGPHRDGAQ